jgi:transposase
VVADHGHDRPDAFWTGSYWTGPGRAWLSGLPLPAVSRRVVADSLAVIDAIAPTIEQLDREVHARAKTDPRVKVLTALPGVGEFTAMVLLAEIGDIARFSDARKLASWARATPTVRGFDQTVHQGTSPSRAHRTCGGCSARPRTPPTGTGEFAATYQAIARRRGPKIATVAVARTLLTRAYHLLADTDADADGPANTDSRCVVRAPPARSQTGRVTKPRARSTLRHEPAPSRARGSD